MEPALPQTCPMCDGVIDDEEGPPNVPVRERTTGFETSMHDHCWNTYSRRPKRKGESWERRAR